MISSLDDSAPRYNAVDTGHTETSDCPELFGSPTGIFKSTFSCQLVLLLLQLARSSEFSLFAFQVSFSQPNTSPCRYDLDTSQLAYNLKLVQAHMVSSKCFLDLRPILRLDQWDACPLAIVLTFCKIFAGGTAKQLFIRVNKAHGVGKNLPIGS